MWKEVQTAPRCCSKPSRSNDAIFNSREREELEGEILLKGVSVTADCFSFHVKPSHLCTAAFPKGTIIIIIIINR